MPSQSEKARVFRALHVREGAFIIPNPWDAGTARLLAHLGFEALATTSAGYAFSIGKPDSKVGREAMIEHVASIAAAVDLPVSGDLENGYGDSPQDVVQTIQLAAAAGLVGGSIEDSTGRPDHPIYDIRTRHRAHSGSGRGGARTFVSVHPHRARRELSSRPHRSRRHNSSTSGVSDGRCRCSLRAWPHAQRRH